MAKTKKTGMDKVTEEHIKLAELERSGEYQKYLKEYARKMRQLEREASGRNMVEPW